MRAIVAVLVLAACGSGPAAPATDATAPDAAPARAHCRGAGPAPAWATLDAGVLRTSCAEVSALDDAIARVVFGEVAARPWSAIVAPAVDATATLGADGDAAELCAAELAITVTNACEITVRDRGGAIVVGGARFDGATLGYDAPPDAHYYGLGERTGGLDRRGGRYTLWSTDAYDSALGGWRPDADPLYQSIPFLLGLDGGAAHGVLVDDTRRLVYDVAADDDARIAVTTPAPALAAYVIAGPDIKDVIRRHTAMTGRTPLPPRWALGYHQSRWGYAPASRLTDLADTFRARGLPLDGLWLDIQHLRGFRTFTWEPSAFGDPAGLTAALAADDVALTVIADPGLKVDPGWDVYDGSVAGDHLLRDASGAIYEGTAWPGASAFPDFTRAETRAWWSAHVADLVALGVRGIWLDVNEPTTFPEGGGGNTVPGTVLARGDDPAVSMDEVHNVYAVLEAEATWQGLRDAAPDRRPFVLSRAGASGIQRWAAVWTGDTVSSWAGLQQTLPMLLGLGLSGVPFVGSDIGGYSGHATPELFARWIALGSLSPLCRGHVTNGVPDQEPWAFGEEVEEISRRVIAERYRLMPYLYAAFDEAERAGLPVLRPLIVEFPDDPVAPTLGDEAMLGASLLIAPVVEPGATTREVYLPAGRWLDWRSGATFDGPTTITVDVTLQALPMFLRAGGVVAAWPRGVALVHAGSDPGDVLELDVHVGGAGELTLVDDAGDGHAARRRVRYALDGATLTADAPTGHDLRVRLRPIDHEPAAVTLGGAAIATWTWDANARAVTVTLADPGAFTLDVDADLGTTASDTVIVVVEVTLPAGTSIDEPVAIASDANGWTHQPLTRTDATHARGELVVPRGAWFRYKYTRGTWDTVEKTHDCAELDDRYRLGAADDTQADVIARWRDDGC